MTKRESHQKLPNDWHEREKLREKGQFWTPDWVANAMVEYVLRSGSDYVFDPAVGEGAFFRAAKQVGGTQGKELRLLGTEIDETVKHQGLANGLSESDYDAVEIRDFVLDPPIRKYKAIVANPPYIRHHRLSLELKSKLKQFTFSKIGAALDGRTGYHVYFFIRALERLEDEGRLCFIMPADTCEGIFAKPLWKWITSNYRLDAVVTFSPEASPFPGVDTNPLVFMIRNARPQPEFHWARVQRAHTLDLAKWVSSGFAHFDSDGISAHLRALEEGLETGLSRPRPSPGESEIALSAFAKVLRGIATGGNEFFFMTKTQAEALQIPDQYLITAIGRTRDVDGNTVSKNTVAKLEANGRPTRLLSIGKIPIDELPPSLVSYLKSGEEQGLPHRALIAQRKPWYKMETRSVPQFFFAYLGRRSARFIRNEASVVPLTGFLCVYTHRTDTDYIDRLWKVLQHPQVIANLQRVGKSYGEGAVKVEPRALERLPIPLSVLKEAELTIPATTHSDLFA